MTPAETSPISCTRMADYDYQLPQELIAQAPLEDRTASRMMVIDRATGGIDHSVFSDLGTYLNSDDLLVLNDSRVIPARLRIRRASSGNGELLLLERVGEDREWMALARPAKKLQQGETVQVLPLQRDGPSASATIMAKLGDGTVRVRLDEFLDGNLEEFGAVPLPPYITTNLTDPERYQTVYSRLPGSAAAPTAGLHFTEDMLGSLRRDGVKFAFITLHVGLDTFRPVMEDVAEKHEIHSEWCSITAAAVSAIRRCRERGGRVVAVGTTTARTLETLASRQRGDALEPFVGPTNIFITPGYRWKLVDALVTNFHLPESTLMLMVSSFASRELILRAYQEAIERRYRFFSFGDATFIV